MIVKKAIFNFSRFVFGAAATMLLVAASMYAFDVSPDLPIWRKVVGLMLLSAAALVFERFISDDTKAPNDQAKGREHSERPA